LNGNREAAMDRAAMRKAGTMIGMLLCSCALAQQPQPLPAQLTESGQVVIAGRSTPYRIRHLPISSFPQLPARVVELLNRRGCLIPQTYEAHHPENVVTASLERPGSSDWAVLCSAQGTVSLLIFFSSATGEPVVLATIKEIERLQPHDPTGVLGFNWGIDPASPTRIHEAQSAMEHHPPRLDHDALADSTVDHRTVYHFYTKSAWTLVEMPE
jgi:hypothetical protein